MPVTITHGGIQRVFGGVGFGRGMARYERSAGYTPSSIPTAVGARMFFPQPNYDSSTDEPIPAAMGNKWDGGRPAYRERVYAAAKKFGRSQGLTHEDIDELKPRKVA